VEEQVDHADDEQQRHEHRDLNIAERLADRARVILTRRQVRGRRELRDERREQLADRVGHLDRVRARLPHHLEHDRLLDVDLAVRVLGVEPVAVVDVLDAVDDRGDLLETHRRALAVRDDDRPERGGVHELTRRLDVEGRVRPEQLTRRQVHVPVLHRLVDFVDADLLRVELVRIELDADRVLLRALHLHLRHAADHRDPRRDHVLRVIVEHRHRQRARRQVQRDDRLIVRIVLAERRRRRHARGQQRHHRRDRRLHVDGGAVDVAIEIELQRDVGAAGAAARHHRVEARDRRELPLERARDRRGHRARIAAGEAGVDVQRGVIHLRQIAHRQRAIGDDAEQRDARHQQAGGDRTADEDLREVHGSTRY
jgi:hypothetical protein